MRASTARVDKLRRALGPQTPSIYAARRQRYWRHSKYELTHEMVEKALECEGRGGRARSELTWPGAKGSRDLTTSARHYTGTHAGTNQLNQREEAARYGWSGTLPQTRLFIITQGRTSSTPARRAAFQASAERGLE